MGLTIGITETEARYLNYHNWIIAAGEHIKIIKLTPINIDDINNCQGIILTGGVDTHPKFYKNERINYPFAPAEFNILRDDFEINVFNAAQKYGIPLLAICRGMQLVNVALGGNLIQDIEEFGKLDHRRHEETDGKHSISVVKGCLLHQIAGTERGIINSAHHQALGDIASSLKIAAFSPDGIAEAAEWKDSESKPFLLCIQWHPERLAQQEKGNVFEKNIRDHFLLVASKK